MQRLSRYLFIIAFRAISFWTEKNTLFDVKLADDVISENQHTWEVSIGLFFVIEEEMNTAVLSRSASVCQFYLIEVVVLDRGQESWKEEDCDHGNDLCSFLQTFSPPVP